jgi:hypothetical protein
MLVAARSVWFRLVEGGSLLHNWSRADQPVTAEQEPRFEINAGSSI